MANRKRTWTEAQLRDAVIKSKSRRQVLHALKLKEAGGNYSQIKKYILEYSLDTSHFTGVGWNKGMRGIGKPRIPLEKILVAKSSYQSFRQSLESNATVN